MDWSKVTNVLLADVLKHTLIALAFGLALEGCLSVAHAQAYRAQVPVMLTMVVFCLSLSGMIVAMYFSWILLKYK